MHRIMVPLLIAIHRAAQADRSVLKDASSDELRKAVCTKVREHMEPDDVILAEAITYRKSSKRKLLAELIEVHGSRCIYAGRGLGECSDELEVDRIRPGSKGGEYTMANCVVSCRSHNGARSDKSFEDYIGGPVP